MLRQILAVTLMNFVNLPSRIGASVIIVVGVAGVVAVLLGLLAMSAGFRMAFAETAKPDRALIVRGGSNNEMSGWIAASEFAVLENMEAIDVASGEVYVTVSMAKRADGFKADVVGRGVTAAAFDLRPELTIVAGRRFEPGTAEMIVGVAAHREYQGLDVGARVEARNMSFTIVGHFAADGSAVESEVWMDLPIAQDVFRRPGGVSVARVRLLPDANAAAVNTALAADPRLTATLIPEVEFFAAQSASRAALIDVFAYFIASVMAFGATAAAINTMYTAVSRRTVEIGTLRALGFGAGGVVVSVVLEAMVLATMGGVIGTALVYFIVDGYATSTFNGASSSQIAFSFALTPGLAITGLVWALALGFIGGLLPALRAARMPITAALRGA